MFKFTMMRTAALLSLLLPCLPASGISLRILAWDHDVAKRQLAIGHGKESVEITYMHPHARTEPIKLPKEAVNLRLEALDRTGDDGKPPMIPLRLPSEISSPLLLIFPDEKANIGLRVMILEDNTTEFRWGSIRLLNLTPKDLAFRWENKAVALPKAKGPVDIKPGGDTRNIGVMLYLKEDLKTPLYSAVWEHRADLRQLVFVVPNPDPALGPVDFKFISEHRSDIEVARP